MTSFARRAAALRPGEVALADDHLRLGWAEVDDLLNRMIERLRDSELGPRRRVGVFAANAVETVLAHVAGVLAGVSVVPVNSHLTASEAAYIFGDAETRLVLAGPETAAAAVAALAAAGGGEVVAWRTETPGTVAFDEWAGSARGDEPAEDVTPLAQLVYTSGTTGRPKGVELPPASFAGGRTVAEHIERLRQLPFAAYGTHLVVGPTYHTGPMTGVRLLAAGVPLRVSRKFDAAAVLDAIAAERVETSVMVPTHFHRLLALPAEVRAAADVSSLRYVLHSGASCPVEVKRAMLDWWGPVLYEVYGATEVGPTCGIGPKAWLRKPGSVGRPLPQYEALVRDEQGRELPVGAEGVLHFRDATGRGIRYERRGHGDAPVPAGADPTVFTLGEIGYVDADGYVFVTDRAADMVVSGGVNIYPAESEVVIATYPGVADVTCIGLPHPEMGEELVALVVPAPPAELDPSLVRAWCRERLAHYKCPRRVELVSSLPRTEMGKLNKRRLRDAYLNGHA